MPYLICLNLCYINQEGALQGFPSNAPSGNLPAGGAAESERKVVDDVEAYFKGWSFRGWLLNLRCLWSLRSRGRGRLSLRLRLIWLLICRLVLLAWLRSLLCRAEITLLLIAALRSGSIASVIASVGCIAVASSEKLDIVHYYFCRGPLGSALVCPAARRKFSLHINLTALADILLREFGRISPGHDIVPFRVFAHFSASVAVALRRRESESGDLTVPSLGRISVKVTHFRVFAHVTDQHNFIQ